MGHSSTLWSLGLSDIAADEATEASATSEGEEDGEDVEEENAFITLDEMKNALAQAQLIGAVDKPEDLIGEGWNLVYSSRLISLMKRRARVAGKQPGPVEYLMLGRVPDVSARTFLHAQVNRQNRGKWDRTMKAMEVPGDASAGAEELVRGGRAARDTLYYRTKWPWPLKDRDYTLARRCRLFVKERALVLVSKSTELQGFPPVDGVIRVDNYWYLSHDDDVSGEMSVVVCCRCHSTILADAEVDAPGLRFVTVFCDDQKVPLPAALVDLISAQGEKVVPGAIERLYEVAKEEERLKAS